MQFNHLKIHDNLFFFSNDWCRWNKEFPLLEWRRRYLAAIPHELIFNQGVLFEESAFWEELAVIKLLVLLAPTLEKEKCAVALVLTGSFNLQNLQWEQNDFRVWVTALPFTGEEVHVATIGNSVSSLHTNLKVSNFQRCRHAFTCPVM